MLFTFTVDDIFRDMVLERMPTDLWKILANTYLEHVFETCEMMEDAMHICMADGEPCGPRILYRRCVLPGMKSVALDQIRFNEELIVAEKSQFLLFENAHRAIDMRIYSLDIDERSKVARDCFVPSEAIVNFFESCEKLSASRTSSVQRKLLLNNAARWIYYFATKRTLEFADKLFDLCELSNDMAVEKLRVDFAGKLVTVEHGGEPLSPEFLQLIVNLFFGTVRAMTTQLRQHLSNVFRPRNALATDTYSGKYFKAPEGKDFQDSFYRAGVFRENDHQLHQGRRTLILNITGRLAVPTESRPEQEVIVQRTFDALQAYLQARDESNREDTNYPQLQFNRQTGTGPGPTFEAAEAIIEAYMKHSGSLCCYDESLGCIRFRSNVERYMSQERPCKECSEHHGTNLVCRASTGYSSSENGAFVDTLLFLILHKRTSLRWLIDPYVLAAVSGFAGFDRSIAAHATSLGVPLVRQYYAEYERDQYGRDVFPDMSQDYMQKFSIAMIVMRDTLRESTISSHVFKELEKLVWPLGSIGLSYVVRSLYSGTYDDLSKLRQLSGAGGAGTIDADVLRSIIITWLTPAEDDGSQHETFAGVLEALQQFERICHRATGALTTRESLRDWFTQSDLGCTVVSDEGERELQYMHLHFTPAWKEYAEAAMQSARNDYHRERERERVSNGTIGYEDFEGRSALRVPDILLEFRELMQRITALACRQQSLIALVSWLLSANGEDLARFLVTATGDRSLPLSSVLRVMRVNGGVAALRQRCVRLESILQSASVLLESNNYSTAWNASLTVLKTPFGPGVVLKNPERRIEDGAVSFNMLNVDNLRDGELVKYKMQPVSHPFNEDERRLSTAHTCGRLLMLCNALATGTGPNSVDRHLRELFASHNYYGLA